MKLEPGMLFEKSGQNPGPRLLVGECFAREQICWRVLSAGGNFVTFTKRYILEVALNPKVGNWKRIG